MDRRTATEQLFRWAVRGNEDATRLCMLVFDWSNTYDHLVDRQSEDPEADLHQAMWALSVEIPHNPFYQQHVSELAVSVANAVQTWRASVVLQRDADEHACRLAYVMRWIPVEFFLHCARICGGAAWANEIAPTFWRQMTQDYSYEEFRAETET